jgi:hypothetical protein
VERLTAAVTPVTLFSLACTFLKNMGAISSDALCQWSITTIGQQTTPEDIQQVAKKALNKLAERAREKQASGA